MKSRHLSHLYILQSQLDVKAHLRRVVTRLKILLRSYNVHACALVEHLLLMTQMNGTRNALLWEAATTTRL